MSDVLGLALATLEAWSGSGEPPRLAERLAWGVIRARGYLPAERIAILAVIDGYLNGEPWSWCDGVARGESGRCVDFRVHGFPTLVEG